MKYIDLVSYAKEYDVQYRTDSSNLSQDYTRNKIRHTLSPALKEVFGENFQEILESISSRYTSYFALIRQEAQNLLRPKNNWYEIEISSLRTMEGRVALLFEALKNYGFNWSQAEFVCNDLDREQGAFFENDDRRWKLYFANDVLQLVPVENEYIEIDFVLDEYFNQQNSVPFSNLLLNLNRSM